MNIETNLLEDYVNFVDTTTKQNKCFTINIILFILYYIIVFFI